MNYAMLYVANLEEFIVKIAFIIVFLLSVGVVNAEENTEVGRKPATRWHCQKLASVAENGNMKKLEAEALVYVKNLPKEQMPRRKKHQKITFIDGKYHVCVCLKTPLD
jgi:hypothetical protein